MLQSFLGSVGASLLNNQVSASVFTLNLNETFPRLSRSPIVEAIIHWQAHAQNQMEPESLRKTLAEKLPMYAQAYSMQAFGLTATLSNGDNVPVVQHEKRGFVGMRLTSEGGCNVVQFLRDRLVFSRTKSYEHWEPFRDAAKAIPNEPEALDDALRQMRWLKDKGSLNC